MKVLNVLFNTKRSKSGNSLFGVERSFCDYTKYLVKGGNKVISIVRPGMGYENELQKLDTEIITIAAWSSYLDIISIFRFFLLLLTRRPDVIICQSKRAASIALIARKLILRKIPIIAVDHGAHPLKFRACDYIFTVNSYFNKVLVNAGKAQARCIVMPNMIEVAPDYQPQIKREFSKILKLGSLSRLSAEKGVSQVVRAIAILKEHGIECEYLVGGSGSEEQAILALAKELGVEDRFKFLGWVSDKKSFFDSIDIFVFPSLYETFGIALLEAMKYGVPIITTNTWGPDEIIDDGINGIKISRDNLEAMPELIADAVKKLAQDPNLAQKMAGSAFKKVKEQYSAEVVGDKINQVLKEIMKKPKSS